MPRTMLPLLEDHLEGEYLTTSLLVLLTRRDGVVLGFNNSDSAIEFEGDTYEAVDGMVSSAIQSTAGTGIDNSDVIGVLKSARITESDIFAGRYDGARLKVQLVNRLDLSAGPLILLTGFLGQIEELDQQFKAEVLALSQRLKAVVGETYQRGCSAWRLGNPQCKVNMNGTAKDAGNVSRSIRASRTVFSVASALQLTTSADPAASAFYTKGMVKAISGQNAGLERGIKTHQLVSGKAQLVLDLAFPFPLLPGDQLLLEAGCDRLFPTCDLKFNNAPNHHGFHMLMGNDRFVKVLRAS